ncbi:MAG TPA: hypothetical protein ENI07_02145 [Desulfobacterales bacterium]|nr:hypothetical protein [Desulfobacterales bacterium]
MVFGEKILAIDPTSAAILAAALLICFFGFHLFSFSIRIIGFLLGTGTGYTLSGWLPAVAQKPFPPFWDPWVIVGMTLFFGILGIALIKTALKAALFVGGFLSGLLVFTLITGPSLDEAQVYGVYWLVKQISIWSILAGVLFGAAFVFFEKGFIVLYTAAAGAYVAAIQLHADSLLFVFMLVTGMVVQFWLSKGAYVKNLQIISPADRT